MNIASCPITYYGQKYEKVYVSNTEARDEDQNFRLISNCELTLKVRKTKNK